MTLDRVMPPWGPPSQWEPSTTIGETGQRYEAVFDEPLSDETAIDGTAIDETAIDAAAFDGAAE